MVTTLDKVVPADLDENLTLYWDATCGTCKRTVRVTSRGEATTKLKAHYKRYHQVQKGMF